MVKRIAKLIMNKLSRRNEIKLVRLHKKVTSNLRDLTGHLGKGRMDGSNVAQQLAPVFVVGTNRCGASFCTLMLSMHPQIEGIFPDGPPGHRITKDGHSSSGAEANHIWQTLNNPDYDVTKGEAMMWGLPSFISKIYINSTSESNKRRLIDELISARRTDNIPLIMNSHNVFRIALIKDLFPKARFILVTRDHKSYIQSCKHKWTTDMQIGVVGPESNVDYPHIGLHWLLINTIALYDLRKYAGNDYIHVKLEDLQGESSVRLETIHRILTYLNLEPVEIDDSVFDDDYIYLKSGEESDIDTISKVVGDLIDFETSLS